MQLTHCEHADGMDRLMSSHVGAGQSPETDSCLAAASAAPVAIAVMRGALAKAAGATAGLFCEVVATALGFNSIPGASSAARSSELVGEGGGEGVGVGVLVPRLGLPRGRRAWSPTGPCQEGSLEADGEADLAAGTVISLRGLPLGLAALATAAVAAASAASAGVLHEHHASVIAAVTLHLAPREPSASRLILHMSARHKCWQRLTVWYVAFMHLLCIPMLYVQRCWAKPPLVHMQILLSLLFSCLGVTVQGLTMQSPSS